MAAEQPRCSFCGIELVRGKRGPAPTYCSRACIEAARRDRGRATPARGLYDLVLSRRVARQRAERERGATWDDAYTASHAAWPSPHLLELGPKTPLDEYLRRLETGHS